MRRNEEPNINLAIKALEHLETQLDAQRNKVLFADAVSGSSDDILVRELAVMLKQCGVEIGQDRLFDWLRGNGYVYRQPGGRNVPTQRSVELGVLELKKQAVVNAYGKVSVSCTTKVTPKGQVYFFEKVMAQKETINAMAAAKKGAN